MTAVGGSSTFGVREEIPLVVPDESSATSQSEPSPLARTVSEILSPSELLLNGDPEHQPSLIDLLAEPERSNTELTAEPDEFDIPLHFGPSEIQLEAEYDAWRIWFTIGI